MNKVCLVGRLTFNPDINEFNYKKVAKFTVAVDRGLSKEAKQIAKQTADFIRCTAWEARAELIEKYVHKGDQVRTWFPDRQYKGKSCILPLIYNINLIIYHNLLFVNK